jgi:hypothetical protein
MIVIHHVRFNNSGARADGYCHVASTGGRGKHIVQKSTWSECNVFAIRVEVVASEEANENTDLRMSFR